MRSDSEHWRSFNALLAGLLAFLASAIALGNLLVDPYRVFHLLSWERGYTDNERFNKIERVLEQPTRYDGFIVGSSRMGVYDPQWLRHARPHYTYYNLSVFGGGPEEARQMLAALTQRGVDVRSVVMGIDLFSYLGRSVAVTPAYHPHPYVSGEAWVRFYSRYLFAPSLLHCLMKIQQQGSGLADVRFDFATGRYHLDRWDQEIAHDHRRYIERTFGSVPASTSREVRWNEQAFEELGRFKQWLDANAVETTFFIAPHHRLELEKLGQHGLHDFRERVAAAIGTPLIDLTRRQWMSADDWYYEPVHYRPALARQVVRELLEPPDSLVASSRFRQ